MATMSVRGGGGEERINFSNETLKEGERILAPTRRPDGTLRKPIRIRAGYVPQDEVALYQSKGVLLRKGMGAPEVPPGYDPVLDVKPKTKAAKRNERKKEKKQQTALEKGNNLYLEHAEESKSINSLCSEDEIHRSDTVESVVDQMNMLAVSVNSSRGYPLPESAESSNPEAPGADIDKRIRALKKKHFLFGVAVQLSEELNVVIVVIDHCILYFGHKVPWSNLMLFLNKPSVHILQIRLTEAQQQKTDQKEMKPELLEKVTKLETWRNELKLLEDTKAESSTS
ncbi:hypothetical protein GIB67_007179 [Kingdonia uniflora]|uniref:WIBG Mago-binding domain-containing protein n=1 Tax=Kingdonia uniflora TaxID=39325 RepID=A0A7J7NDR3_9MAGN|nr:hypothetical protein GIB67_007179 [Kingdonia uniflora]